MMKKNKYFMWPAILAIIFTSLIKLGTLTPRAKFTGELLLADDTPSLITWVIVSYIGFYFMFNGPIYLRKKKEDRIEGFRRKDKK